MAAGLGASRLLHGAGSGRADAGGRTGSVQEALAGLLPPAGRAPLVPVLDAVHLPALLGLSTGFPAAALSPGRGGDDHVRLHGGWRLLGLAEAEGAAPDRREGRGGSRGSGPADAGVDVGGDGDLEGWQSLVGMVSLNVPEGARS